MTHKIVVVATIAWHADYTRDTLSFSFEYTVCTAEETLRHELKYAAHNVDVNSRVWHFKANRHSIHHHYYRIRSLTRIQTSRRRSSISCRCVNEKRSFSSRECVQCYVERAVCVRKLARSWKENGKILLTSTYEQHWIDTYCMNWQGCKARQKCQTQTTCIHYVLRYVHRHT